MHPCKYFNEEISLSKEEEKIVDDFHKLYFEKLEQRSGLQLSWQISYRQSARPLGYQEIIYEYRPDL